MDLLTIFPPLLDPPGIASWVGSTLGDGWNVTGVGAALDDEAALAGAEAILITTVGLREDAIGLAKNLRFVQTPSHGFDHIDIEALAARGIPVANVGTSGAESGTVAEHAILLMLACARRLIDAHTAIRDGGFPGMSGATWELQGKTLGIVGFGHIGRELAVRAKAFGMTLQYSDVIRASEDVERELGITNLPLDEVLATSDVVSVHVPLMASTRGLIGRAELERMKPGAVLVNTSRGPVVDNQALADVLATGRIMAGIDVIDPEPPQADHPLRSAPNIVLTPHQAGTTRESVVRIMDAAFENLRRFGRGEPVKDVVNGV